MPKQFAITIPLEKRIFMNWTKAVPTKGFTKIRGDKAIRN